MKTEIKTLKLTNFRNHNSFSLETESPIISVVGQNGSGKTNILESISLLSPNSKGIRGAKISEYQNFKSKDDEFQVPWAVFSKVDLGDDNEISLGVSYEKDGADKKIFNLDGDKPKKPNQEIPQYFNTLSLVPSQDHTFSSGSTSRREFLDKISSVFFSDYSSFLNNFESLKTQRKKLLYSYPPDDAWISSIEEQMASNAVVVASYRNEVISLLNEHMKVAEMSEFPIAELGVAGKIETSLLDQKALEVEGEYKEVLKSQRQQDKESNRTNSGVHRSDFRAIHKNKNLPAEICSMGEQKAVLLSIILSSVLAKKHYSGRTPILLLDEVAAHLDDVKRSKLYEFIKDVNCQTWLTSTEEDHFQGLECEIVKL